MRCCFQGCSVKRAVFAFAKADKKRYCKKHSESGMEDVITKRCIHNGCKKGPCFGLEWKKPTHCLQHALDKMENVKSKRCQHIDCTKVPNFGFESKNAIYCKQHSLEGMWNVKCLQCKHSECKKQPTYGIELKKPTYCIDHALEGMKDVMSKRCQNANCNKQATFGIEWQKPICCKQHASDNMENVKNKRCAHGNCKKRPTFGYARNKAIYCVGHALDGMKDVKNRRCKHYDCDTICNFGITMGRPTHCAVHALTNMFNVITKQCATCNTTTMNRNYKPNCARCHFYLNPDDPRIRNYKTKEQAFMVPLQKIYSDMKLDKIISGGCSKRRPDGFIDCLTHCIIIEIDEDQHLSYNTTCDNRRTMELFQDVGDRPLIFIRLNPDSYVQNDKRIKSVFTKSRKTGELSQNKKMFAQRFEMLHGAVATAIATIPDREVTIVQLCYSD